MWNENEEAQPAAEAIQKKMADAGLVLSQINLEREKLRSPDESARAAAFRKLLELASSSADAKFVLATCIRTACVSDAGGNAEVRALMIDAARLGHFEALRYLSRPTPFGRRGDLDLEVSAAEHYAWNSVYEALQADGCFGMVPFGIWARRTQAAPSEALMAMSPAEAKEAERRARELLAAELPTIRANTACE